MIDYLPKDIPVSSGAVSAPSRLSSDTSKPEQKFSDVVEKVSTSNKKNTPASDKDVTGKDEVTPQKSKHQTPDDAESEKPSAESLSADKAKNEKPLDGTGVVNSKDAVKSTILKNQLNIDIPEVTEPDKVVAKPEALAATPELLAEETDDLLLLETEKTAQGQITSDAIKATPVAAQILTPILSVSPDGTSKKVEPNLIVGKSVKPQTAAVKPLSVTNQDVEIPVKEALSAKYVAAEVSEQTKDKQVKLQPIVIKPHVVETRQTEQQKTIQAIIKNRTETKISSNLAQNSVALELDTGALKSTALNREAAVMPLLTDTQSNPDRPTELKTLSAPLDRRIQAAVQTQSLTNIRFMIEQNQRGATIQLHPAELGSLKVGIDIQSDHLNVHINAAQSMTRDALEMLLPKMRNQLMQQGFSAVDITLSGGQSENEASPSQQGFTEGSPDENSSENIQQPALGEVSAEFENPVGSIGRSRQLVDLFA